MIQNFKVPQSESVQTNDHSALLKVSSIGDPYSEFAENADTGIFYLDTNLFCTRFNAAFKDAIKAWYGITLNPGDNILFLMEGTDEVAPWTTAFTAALAGLPQQIEKSYLRNKKMQYVSFSLYPVMENGVIAGLSCFAHDITHQKLAEEKLRASEQRYRLISNNPILGISWVSPNGKILHANETYCKMLGYTNLEMVDMHYSKITHPDDIEPQRILLEKLYSGELESYQCEKRYVTKNRKIIWGELIFTTAKDKDGRVKYVVGLVQNITQRKNAEAELIDLNEQLEIKIKERTEQLQQANRELETFSYTVSHDLQTPLRTINGFAKVLLLSYAEKLEEDGKSLVKSISKISSESALLIRHLLEFSKLEKAELKKQKTGIKSMVQSVLDEVAADSDAFNGTIQLGELKDALCDPTLIKQVWANLIWNAVKYSAKKQQPVIEIGMIQKDSNDVYYIKDNGAGFNMADCDLLFRPFQRLHAPDEFSGSGIGLATVHRIITRHGGRIWAEAGLDKGACFYFTLPG